MAEEKQGMLFPPLDDSNDGSSESVECDMLARDSAAADNDRERLDCTSSSLPKPLRDRFATVRAMLRSENEDDQAKVELKRKQQHAALDVAMAVEREVSRLESAIAELEALQQRQNELQDRVLVIPNEANHLGVEVESNLDEEQESIASHHWEDDNDLRLHSSRPFIVHDESSR